LDAFEQKAQEFAESLSDTVQAVAGPACRRFSAALTTDRDFSAFVTQDERVGIPLTRKGSVILRLTVTIKLTTDHVGEYLRVDESQVKVFAEGGRLPVFRYEYAKRMESKSRPAADIQVHGEHPELQRIMIAAGLQTSRSARGGGLPDITDLHLPVGGTRFRPCLEDVLEMLIQEFGIDPLPNKRTALRALAAGRQNWRTMQLRTAVRDNPAEAAAQLQAMGYGIARPADHVPKPRLEYLRRM
jgi:hypothetical protein